MSLRTCRPAPGRCTFTTTLSPPGRTAPCTCPIEAAAIGELHADFVKGDGIAQLIDKHTRRRHAVDVERDDQPIADGIVAHAEGLPPWPALR